jgi:hypothetical protein
MNYIYDGKQSIQIINLDLVNNIRWSTRDFAIIFNFGKDEFVTWKHETLKEMQDNFESLGIMLKAKSIRGEDIKIAFID